MDAVIIGSWILLFFTIPIAVILVAGNAYGRDKTVKIVGKFLISIGIYLITTIFSFVLSVLIVVGPEGRRSEPLDATGQIIGLAVVYFYALVGYFLCSYVNGDFLKPWKFSIFSSKKHRTIFDKK